ncbi:MAG: M23 family metallopeptidase [Dehalococcoidia bacterium]|nr:M23 family metallopeptidase [Dehalococcoidia bacterium]
MSFLTINKPIKAGLLVLGLFLLTRPDGFVIKSSADTVEEYRLPWKSSQRMYTLQGQNQGTHVGFSSRYAFDFAPGPTDGSQFEVLAVKSGKVVMAAGAFAPGLDCDPSASARSNFVLLDHGDGTGSRYEHLAQGSILVKLGQRVAQGAVLATSGTTGFVCGIRHLHYTALDIKTMESIHRPFSDPDVKKDNGAPKTGERYSSTNIRISSKGGKSFLPVMMRGYSIPSGRESTGTRAP